MLEIARYIPTDAQGAVWEVSVDDISDLYGLAIITDYGNINIRPYPQLYYGYFFFTADSSVATGRVYIYVDTGDNVHKESTAWKTITSSEGNTYYYFTFRPREIVEMLDYNNKQYAGASFTNTCEIGDVISNGRITATSDRDDYALMGLDYLEETYGPGGGGGGGGGGYGKGVVTLEIATAGEELTFESSLLEKSITQFIDNDTTINFIGAEADWEILWQFSFGGDNGQILINSDFEAINDLLTNSLTGDLLRSTYESSANNVYAQKNIVAKNGRTDGLSAFTNVSANQMFAAFSGYDRLIIAKSGSGISMPFEVGFHWQVGQSMQMCLVKQDGTFVPHDYYVTGEYVTVGLYGFTTTAFNGTLKYYYAKDPGSSAHQEGWVELDASVAQNIQITVNMFIVFAIPN